MPAMRQVDLCVIGSGPGGQKAAIQAAKLGKRVCVVERRERIGGVAVHTGTIPEGAARDDPAGRRHPRRGAACRTSPPAARGLGSSGPTTTRSSRPRRRSSETARRTRSKSCGGARFADPHTVEVIGQTATETIAAGAFVIAVGSVPARPPQVPFDSVNVFTTDDVFGFRRRARS
jgi:NAD(P) transhydrogenase